ncbi:phosphatase PAP2 family protein [Actinoplanes sp. CA-142083]|uniref:phosphatase PAP2 family protein n=1 Tax=Actinoplanes sp. CA-142083 TaxID=3239903 RepID=UPI003D90E673
MRPELRLTERATGAILLLVPVALLAILVVGNVAWLHTLDGAITDALHGFALRHRWWVDAMSWWSLIFHPNVWRVAALGLVIWLARRRRWPLAWWVAVTMTAGGILGGLLKLLVGRHRPDLLDPVARAAGYSFPSGHALNNALGAAVFLIVLLPHTAGRPRARFWLWAGAVVIPLITCVSRVALGVHWTSDVVAGLLLGVAVALIARYRLPASAPRGIEERRIG